jgi:glycerol uptake facilitator protein
VFAYPVLVGTVAPTVTLGNSRKISEVDVDNIGVVFVSEIIGTAMLLLLGTGVVANVVLAKNKGFGGGFLMINFGWGLGVFMGVLVAYKSGAHLNPAVTLGLVAAGVKTFGSGVPVNVASVLVYLAGQLIGAIIGAVLCFLAYRDHFAAEEDPGSKLAVFSTGPAIRSYAWNLITEIIGTFVLVFVVLTLSHQGKTGGLAALGALPVALVVVGIGASLGGPTGYAINPARDLGPRIAHALLPIPGKGSSDWSYAWVPVVGPIIGGVLAGLASLALLPT